MTRKKKTRRQGSEGEAQYSEKRMSEQEMLSLLRKKQGKRKGLKAGSRHSAGEKSAQRTSQKPNDPRLGSKKPVPLVVEAPSASKKMSHSAQKHSAEKELQQLENDPQLLALLDRIENGERLGSGLQSYVDEKLDRIEQLMGILGLLEPEDEDDEPAELSLSGEKAATQRVSASEE
ncbi:MAG: Der GTPase-activating protein YihI [Enterovibrio sp.]